mmetsp:Transcript_60543/g.175321  ORF Transcript_60543/g.175321 Transcript_60543/m.175321 type:complete len:82 (+) Transcript_60543:119-364(+)
MAPTKNKDQMTQTELVACIFEFCHRIWCWEVAGNSFSSIQIFKAGKLSGTNDPCFLVRIGRDFRVVVIQRRDHPTSRDCID